MSYQKLRFTITGTAALLMHNGRLADPSNEYAKMLKVLTSKRLKTEADFMKMAEIEWFGGLWTWNKEPCLPSEAIEAALVKGAGRRKMTAQVKAGVICTRHAQLLYDGPSDPRELWPDKRFRLQVPVRVQKGRVIRTRPRFSEWRAEVEVEYLPSLVSQAAIEELVVATGELVGVGDWRPRYGRFAVAFH